MAASAVRLPSARPPLRRVGPAPLAAALVALAAPAAAQAPGMVPGVHDLHLKGIGVGTRLRRVRRLYPGAERTINIGAPGGFNLVWKRGRKRRFVFEVHNGRVFGIKSGVMPWIKWQECA